MWDCCLFWATKITLAIWKVVVRTGQSTCGTSIRSSEKKGGQEDNIINFEFHFEELEAAIHRLIHRKIPPNIWCFNTTLSHWLIAPTCKYIDTPSTRMIEFWINFGEGCDGENKLSINNINCLFDANVNKISGTEFPTVDGHLSINTYLGAIDNNYKTINAKYQRANLPAFSLEAISYGCFHAPFSKMVQKAFTRVFYNDLL